MSGYRRASVPGGTFFFTLCLADRGGSLLTDRAGALRAAYVETARAMPFRTEAVVVLPDHLHAVWTLPEGDADFSTRWKRIKRGFTVRVGGEHARSASKKARKGEAGLWQRRFWGERLSGIGPGDRSSRERAKRRPEGGCVRDEAELAACLLYVWCNPVKHGYVARAADWPWSSVHREIRAGRLPPEGP